MRLPMQSEPVQRTITAAPFANRGNGASGAASGQGVVPSEYGVEPSQWWKTALKSAPQVIDLISSFF